MTGRPKVLLLSTAYLPLVGGSELAISHLAERMHGYDFDLITRHDPKSAPAHEQMGRVRVFRVSSPKFLLPVTIGLKALMLSLRNRYVLVHAYQASQAGGAAWLLRFLRLGLPMVLTLQEGKELDRQARFTKATRSLIIRRADRITVISEYLAAYARRYTKRQVTLVPNGVTIRDVPHVANPDPTILTVSRLVPKNNVEGVIRAFAVVRKSIPNARLLIVGDGPLHPQLAAAANGLGVRDAVQFMGTVPHSHLPAVYAAADVFVRPSLSEGLGSVFLEAMAARVPVVASAVGGIPDIVHDGQTGLLCDPNDAVAIAHAVVRLLQDQPLREHIIAHADRMVREQYDWNALAVKMESVYAEVIRAKR